MIPSNFYPSDPYAQYQQSNLDLTATIPNIPISTSEFSDAYWLGWINYDNLPSIYHLSKFELSDTIATFSDSTEAQNYPVGYSAYFETSSYPIAQQTVMLTNNGNGWSGISGITLSNQYATNYSRLPNNLDVNCTNWDSVNIGLSGLATDGTNDAFIYGFFQATNPLLTGQFSVQLIKAYGALTYNARTVTLNYDDFNERGIIEFVDGGISHKIAFTACYIMYGRDNTIEDSVGQFCLSKPIIQIADTTGQQFVLGVMSNPYTTSTNYAIGSGEAGNGILIDQTGSPSGYYCYNNNDDNFQYIGGFNGSFDVSEIDFNKTTVYFPDDTNFMIICYSYGTNAVIDRMYSVDDLRKTFALATRYILDHSSGKYENSDNYLYAHVSEENEFLCELIDGTHTEPEGLRDWQIIGNTIVDNNFDPEDIPPYEPPSPGSDLEELGDSIDIQTPSIGVANNFLTMYALTEAQVSNFGSVLWTSWVEEISPGEWSLTKMIDNFTAGFDLLTTTASFDISSVLQFIVSLRVYPFSLVNLHITQNAGQVAYIGRGEYGINCGGGQNILKFTESMGYLNAGSLTVPRHFGDWRDHDNTTVMAYLPYCGTVELNPSDVVGRTLVCTYAVDVYTGQCMAVIESYSPEDLGGKHYPIAITHGTIGVSIPVSTTNSGQIAGAFINSAMNVMQIVSGAVTDAAVQVAGAQLAMNSKSMSKQSSAYKDAYVQQQAQEIAFNLGNAGLGVENEALGYLSSKGVGFPTLSGGSGLTSFIEPSSAYIQIRRGLYKTNDQYDHTNGKPSTDARPLSSYIGTGLTICNNVDVSGLTCHEYEKAAIKEMLASGVYL